MSRSLEQILSEADAIIEKRASKKASAPQVTSSEDDDVFKLAEAVRCNKTAASKTTLKATEEDPFCFDDNEKLANSMAILETVLSADELGKLIELEKVATERNIPQEEINAFFEKVASASTVGRKVQTFVEGAGKGMGSLVDALPKKLPKDLKSSGELVGAIAPFAAALGLGSYAGARLKERNIQNAMGFP